MTDEYKKILEKAIELSDLIKSHEITINYNNSLIAMRRDKDSQKLLEKLVMLGKMLNEKQKNGKEVTLESNQEIEMIRKELDNNQLTKEHIIYQKEYLNLVSQVIDRIKNPVED